MNVFWNKGRLPDGIYKEVCGYVRFYRRVLNRLQQFDTTTLSALLVSAVKIAKEIYKNEKVQKWGITNIDKVIDAFIYNCEGKNFNNLHDKMKLPMCRSTFAYEKRDFIREVARELRII